MNKAEILIIDDEPQIQKLLEIILESNGYKVQTAVSGKEGILLAANHPPELIILDLGLPDKSGHEVLKELRSWYTKSILILSVQDSEDAIIAALDSGASDYLTKPFRSGELLARIRASIRRNTINPSITRAQFADLTIDFAARTLLKNNQVVKLTSTEYNLFTLFAKK